MSDIDYFAGMCVCSTCQWNRQQDVFHIDTDRGKINTLI